MKADAVDLLREDLTSLTDVVAKILDGLEATPEIKRAQAAFERAFIHGRRCDACAKQESV